jgi:hypothetical protein
VNISLNMLAASYERDHAKIIHYVSM